MRKTSPSSVTTVVSMSSGSEVFTDLFNKMLWRSDKTGDFFMANCRKEMVPIKSAYAILDKGVLVDTTMSQPRLLKFIGYLKENDVNNNIVSIGSLDKGTTLKIILRKAFFTTPSNPKLKPVSITGFKFCIDPAAVGIKRQTEEPHDGGMAKKGRVDSEGFAIPAPAPAKTVTAPAKTVAEPVKPVVQAASSPMAYHEYAGGALKIVSGTVVFEAKAYALTFACLTMECGDDITIPLDTAGLSEAIDTLGVVRHSRRTNKVYFVNAIPGLKILGKTGVQRLELYYNPVPVTA